ARVGEAGEPLEEDLHLEELLHLPIARQAREPCFAGLSLLAPEAARVAQEIVVRVALLRHAIDTCTRDGHGGDVTRATRPLEAVATSPCVLHVESHSRPPLARGSKKVRDLDDTWVVLPRTNHGPGGPSLGKRKRLMGDENR